MSNSSAFRFITAAVYATVESNRGFSIAEIREQGPPACMRDFSCTEEPSISIIDFMKALSPLLTPEEWVIGLMILDRAVAKAETRLGVLNVHRLLLAAMMTAMKLQRDVTGVNAVFARLVGLSLSETAIIEKRFLSLLEFDLAVTSDQYMYTRAILPSLGEYCAAGRRLLPPVRSR